MGKNEFEETRALVGDLRDLAKGTDPGETEGETAARLRLIEITTEISERLSQLEGRLGEEEESPAGKEREEGQFEALGRVTAEVSHRLNDLLAALATRMELVRLCLAEKDYDKAGSNFDLARNYLHQLETIAIRLIDFSGRPTRKLRSDLNEIARVTVSFVRLLSPYENIEFQTDLAPDLVPVTVDPARWQQLLLSLISNGADAVGRRKGEGGLIRIATKNLEEKGLVLLVVRDEGKGISPGNLPRLFQPGFSTKGRGRQGLGLTTCRRIVEEAGGTIVVESEQGRGTTVTISIPIPG